jgi:hypothetical protein
VRGLDWREVRLEDVGEFVALLRLPPAVRTGAVTVLPSVEHHCGEATVKPLIQMREDRLELRRQHPYRLNSHAHTTSSNQIP